MKLQKKGIVIAVFFTPEAANALYTRMLRKRRLSNGIWPLYMKKEPYKNGLKNFTANVPV